MTASMSLTVSSLSGYGRVRRVTVSLPLVSELLAEPGTRYFLPGIDPDPAVIAGDPALVVKRRRGEAERRRRRAVPGHIDAALRIKASSFLIDGEAVIARADGMPDFR